MEIKCILIENWSSMFDLNFSLGRTENYKQKDRSEIIQNTEHQEFKNMLE